MSLQSDFTLVEGGLPTRSAPFNISDIGKSYVTLLRPGSRSGRQYLLQVETHITGSTIFIIVKRETESWPLRLRNDTDTVFSFQQTVR